VIAAGAALESEALIVVGVVVSGLVSGVLNTMFTGAAMSSATTARSVSSAGYNFCRWMGGAISAILVGHLAEWFGSDGDPAMAAPFWAAALCCLIAVGFLSLRPRDRPAGAHTDDDREVPV